MATTDGTYTPQVNETWYSPAKIDQADAEVGALSLKIQQDEQTIRDLLAKIK